MRKAQDSDYTHRTYPWPFEIDILVTVNEVMVTTIKLSNG